MVFNNNIKILRQRKNRTQDIIAGELNVSRSTVNSYENGSIKNPTLDALMMFSKYYKVSIDTLVKICLLYTSDAADERSSVDLGGRRIIKKKKKFNLRGCRGST